MTHMRTLLATFVLSSQILLFAAPPPELTALQQQYAFALAERVASPFERAVGELNAKYAGALDSAATQAKGSGDLPTLLAIQADKKLLTEKQPLPEDDDKTPEALKKLRSIYRGQFSKITEQRTANATALLTPYAVKLKELEAKLTKTDRIAEAQEVLTYREGLKGDAPLVVTEASPRTTTSVGTSGKEKTAVLAKVKGDARKAAEWVLSVGGKVKVGEGASEEITSLAALPKEQYNVHAIILDNNAGNIKPFTDADFAVCGGLEKLDWVALNKLEITPAAFDTLCTCPNLTKITIQYNRMGDELWAHLAGAKKLITLFQNYDGLPVRGIGLSKLSNETLTQLNLAHTALSDEALPELAALTKLGQLYLEDTKVTDAGIKALVTLKKLTRMQLHNTEVTASGLAALKSLPIAKLGYGNNLAATVSQAQEVASLFPKLDELLLPRECNPTAEDWSTLAKAWPKLRRVTVSSHILDDASCAGLLPLSALEELDLNYCPVTDTGVASLAALKKLFWLSIPNAKINDATLDTLAKMKSLKTLKLPKPGNGLTADGIAKFKKQRPDIQVN